MSADNWAMCPNCKKIRDTTIEIEKAKLSSGYGFLSENVYMTRQSAIQQIQQITEPTLREDYEIGVDQDGIFHVNYYCSCAVCKFSYDYQQNVQVISTEDSVC